MQILVEMERKRGMKYVVFRYKCLTRSSNSTLVC